MTRSINNPKLHRFVLGTALATFCLVWVGGLVTSHGAGMAVPDWPTTYGHNMFTFPISKWVGGILYEHPHRLVASAVGFLTVILALWLWVKEERRWLRRLGWVALGAVILQGVLGGLRVTAMKDELGIFHAALAQLFFGLISGIALVTSPWWHRQGRSAETGTAPRRWKSVANRPGEGAGAGGEMAIYAGRRFRYLFAAVAGLVFLQLVLGASMRHQHAGLAIPDFPLAYGALWPRADADSVARYNRERVEVTALNPITAGQIHLQMTHRLMALLILAAVAWTAGYVRRQLSWASPLSRISLAWLGLILVQAVLGALTIWTNKAPGTTTAHVAVGALSLVTGSTLALMAGRLEARDRLKSSSTASGEQPASVAAATGVEIPV